MFIAVTGGIGAGKTTVLQEFRKAGAMVADADEIAHSFYQPGSAVCQEMSLRWGREIFSPDGMLRRQKVAEIVFSSERERLWLEGLTHPRIRERIAGLSAEARASGRHFFCAIPLLYESGWPSQWDAVAAVWCPAEVQMRRLLARGWTEQEASRRIASQLSMDEKLYRADFGIMTDCSWKLLEEQCRQVVNNLR